MRVDAGERQLGAGGGPGGAVSPVTRARRTATGSTSRRRAANRTAPRRRRPANARRRRAPAAAPASEQAEMRFRAAAPTRKRSRSDVGPRSSRCGAPRPVASGSVDAAEGRVGGARAGRRTATSASDSTPARLGARIHALHAAPSIRGAASTVFPMPGSPRHDEGQRLDARAWRRSGPVRPAPRSAVSAEQPPRVRAARRSARRRARRRRVSTSPVGTSRPISSAIAAAISSGPSRLEVHAAARAVAGRAGGARGSSARSGAAAGSRGTAAGRGQLHRRRQPALHDGEVAGGQVAVQVVDVRAHLEAVGARQRRRVDARAGDDDHPQRRDALAGLRERGDRRGAAACSPTPEPPTVTMHTCSSAP